MLRSRCLILLLMLLAAIEVSAEESTAQAFVPELGLAEVLRSADASFPLLQATRLETAARTQQALAADGAFDTRLSLQGDVRPLGFYENRAASVSLEQPTTLWGARLYAKYRYGDNDVPSYDGGIVTDRSGEVSAGIELPLLRNGRIDRARAELRRAAIDLESLTPELELARIEVLRDAKLAYWDWVATGKIVDIAEALVEVAEARQGQIAARAERGAEAPINLSDNQRLVVERRARLRGAQRDFRQATIVLSLFLRSEDGKRIIVDESRLPDEFPAEFAIDEATLKQDLQRARDQHPQIRKLEFERERRSVDLDVARNEVLPDMNLVLEGSRDMGSSRGGINEVGKLSDESRSSTEVKLGVRLDLPVRFRAGRGRLGAVRVRIDQLERRIQYARDQVETDVLIAEEGLSSSLDQTIQARENVELAELLRRAELRKLNAGLSNLIDVNIREVQAASAAQDLVLAQRSYFQALANYKARVVASHD